MQVWTYNLLFMRLTYVTVVLGGQKISGADIRDQNGISLSLNAGRTGLIRV